MASTFDLQTLARSGVVSGNPVCASPPSAGRDAVSPPAGVWDNHRREVWVIRALISSKRSPCALLAPVSSDICLAIRRASFNPAKKWYFNHRAASISNQVNQGECPMNRGRAFASFGLPDPETIGKPGITPPGCRSGQLQRCMTRGLVSASPIWLCFD